ncbi:MAG: asparagine synthase (glutamine-hydrolyzing) [Euryarchaeota archaeon]|nr:asparagine synthase (glutamine-hydrolyzing) [Euryarchaeota archaeon]
MCGIVGYGSLTKVDNQLIKNINNKQSHRGPDSQGLYISNCKKVSLAMSRLAILDINHGHQPMTLNKEQLSIVFNGEIFNSSDIKNDIVQNFNDKFFSSHSDTEVILRLYKHKGVDSLKELNGMFSFIIFDGKSDKLIFARDRFGIKPLVFKKTRNSILIASEVQAISNSFKNLKMNKNAISEYINFGFISAPNTVYNDIHKLPHGNIGVFCLKTGKLSISRWPGANINSNKIIKLPSTQIHKTIKHTFSNAVERWQQSDEDICYSLSGGKDATSIAAIASKKKKIATFTVGYKNKYENWSEFQHAREISKLLKTDHTEIEVDLESYLDDLPKIISMFGEPFGGGLPSFNLFKEISKNFKVVMTGIGADELFGNYLRSKRYNNFYKNNQNLTFNKKKYTDLIYLNSDKGFNTNLIGHYYHINNNGHLNFNNNDNSIESQICNFDLNTQLPYDFLHMSDILSMNFGVEARTPFLDLEFVKLITSIPYSQRIDLKNYKSLLVNSLGDDFPQVDLSGKKFGFSLPISFLMREIMRSTFDRLMKKKNFLKLKYFTNNFFDDVINNFLNGDNRFLEIIWRAFILQMWIQDEL